MLENDRICLINHQHVKTSKATINQTKKLAITHANEWSSNS